MALVNVRFLGADAALAAEELLVELPGFLHLGVDTKILLEEKRDVMDETDCSTLQNATAASRGGFVSRLMIARLRNARFPISDTNETVSNNRPRVNCFDIRKEQDLFSGPSLVVLADHDQHGKVATDIE